MWKPSEETIKYIHKDLLAGRTNYTKLWKSFGVSDNAVRKWFKRLELDIPKKIQGRKTYTCAYCSTSFIDDVSRSKNSKNWNFYCNISCKGEHQKKKR